MYVRLPQRVAALRSLYEREVQAMTISARLLRPINKPAPAPKVNYTVITRSGLSVIARNGDRILAKY